MAFQVFIIDIYYIYRKSITNAIYFNRQIFPKSVQWITNMELVNEELLNQIK